MEASDDEPRPAHDPHCYLCPRNERAGGLRNPDYTGTWAFDNDFPALQPLESSHETAKDDELLVAAPAGGVCRVLCFSPRHDVTLAHLTPDAIRLVVDAWAGQVAELGARPDIRYVQVFENKGAAMGCSNPHPHGQIWATDHVPLLPSRKLATQRRYHETHGGARDLLGDYLARELDLARRDDAGVQAGERHDDAPSPGGRGTDRVVDAGRVVCANDDWVVLIPFWAVWPFETLVLPRRRVPDLPSLDDRERDSLAAIVSDLTRRYDRLFNTSFPYSMGWHGRPTDGDEHPWWRVHAVFLPPLLRSATVRKFLVGYELTAEPQRDLTAEQAAERLREAGIAS